MGITQPKPHPQPNIAGSPTSDRNTLQEPKFIEIGSYTPFSFDQVSLEPNSRFGEKFGEDDDPETPTVPTVFKWSLPAHSVQLSFIGPFAPTEQPSPHSDHVADNKANSSPARPVKFFSALSALIGSGSNGTSTPVTSGSPPTNGGTGPAQGSSPQSASIPIPLRPIAPLPILQSVSQSAHNSVGTPANLSRSSGASTPMTPLSYHSVPAMGSTSPNILPQGLQWSEWSPMVKSDGEHLLVHNLRPGRYLYRFKVDGKVRHNPQDSFTSMPPNVLAAATAMLGATPISNSSDPKLANLVDVRPLHEFTSRAAKADLSSSPPGEYGQVIIDFSAPEPAPASVAPGPVRKGSSSSKDRERKKAEPVELPAHLERALLNTNSLKHHKGGDNVGPENSIDVRLDTLPLPHHVMLNHLYFQSRHVSAEHIQEDSATQQMDEDVLVLGLSLRYKNKYVTTVFYTSVEEEDLIEELPSPPGDATPNANLSPAINIHEGDMSPPIKQSEPQNIKPKSFEEHRVIRLDDSPIKFSDGSDLDSMPVE